MAGVRAIRGAVQVDANDREPIIEATAELVAEVMARNERVTDDVISVLFNTPPRIWTAEFPALAARKTGFHDVPLLCATEIDMPTAMPRVVRLLMHVETERPRARSVRQRVPAAGPPVPAAGHRPVRPPARTRQCPGSLGLLFPARGRDHRYRP